MVFRISELTVLRSNDLPAFKRRMRQLISKHRGRCLHIAQDIGVGRTTVKRWLREYPVLHAYAVKIRERRVAA